MAVALTFLCAGTSIASNLNKQTNAQVTNNMQVMVPNNYVTSVPYAIVFESTTKVS